MKKIKFILIVLLLAGFGACNYLDVSPDLGISEEDIFSTYKNYSNFLDAAYRREYPNRESHNNARNLKLCAPYWIDQSSMRWVLEGCITDAGVCGRKLARAMRSVSMSDETATRLTTATTYRPIMKVMFEIIRITNTSIANIDMLQDATDAQRNDLLARAYFARGMAHFTLCRYFGGMPYIDTKLGADDEWDMARLSGHDTYVRCAGDFGRAADYYRAAGLMRRDARPGEAGHLSSPDMWYANGCAALAMKGRALLYAASPLHNALGEEDWRLAAEACGEAIAAAEDAGFEMLPKEQWTDNFMNVQYTNEQLWCYSVGNIKLSNSRFFGRYGQAQCDNQKNASGICPTQNFVDRFETIWGDPLDTEEDRAAAVALGHYNDQDPYADRDPRFDLTILHDGSKVGSKNVTVNIYRDTKGTWPKTKIGNDKNFGAEWDADPLRGTTRTGYYLNKGWNGERGNTAYRHSDPLIRMAELYLNYAEAVNEYAGPGGTAAGLPLTALQAVNKVRSRIGMPDVQSRFAGDSRLLRDRIRNERMVELAFEGHHYYFDSRRWKTVETDMNRTLYGMFVEQVSVSAEYPKGRRYTRRALTDDCQGAWKPHMYYLPIPDAESQKMRNFVNNAKWN